MMTKDSSGYTGNGLPFNRLGSGPRNLVVFQGLSFENKPAKGMMLGVLARNYRSFADEFTVTILNRKRGLSAGYTLADMAADYANWVREEIGGSVDVIGLSTGGSISLVFAAEYPELTRSLVVHSSAHSLGDKAKNIQLRVGDLAADGKWRKAYAEILDFMNPPGPSKIFLKPFYSLFAFIAGTFGIPEDPSDLVTTIQAEDKFAFQSRLKEIQAPVLVAGGSKDPFYSDQLFRETAEGIPNGRLVLYAEMGHPTSGKQFAADLSEFLHGV